MTGKAFLLFVAFSAASATTATAPDREFVLVERRLSPAVDARGRPWRVEVLRADPAGPEEILAVANARLDGWWRHARVPAAAPVRLRVCTEDGDVWWVSTVPFAPDGVERTGTIDLGMLPVLGIVRVGKQPLPGLVVFTDEVGSLVRFVSTIDGEFEGALPRAGTWTTQVKSSAATFDRSLEVEVREPETEAPSFVDVHFRDSALRGEVVDEKGNPADGFTLAISEVGASTETLEEYEGSTFRYERVAPGHYFVRLFAPRKTSPTYAIEIPHDDDPDFIRAALDTRKEFRGRVVSPAGAPVSGGRGILTFDGDEGWTRPIVSPAGPRAAFRFSLPSSARWACLILHPPGHATTISSWPATDEEHRIVVSPVGGDLTLEAPREAGRMTLVFRNGCFDFVASLAQKQGAVNDDRGAYVRVALPAMEAGAYSLCNVTSKEKAAFPGGAPAFPRCVHGVLALGGRLELDLGKERPGAAP